MEYINRVRRKFVNYQAIMNTYLKVIVGEILLFLFLCVIIVVVMSLAPRHGWVDHKMSKIIIVLTVLLWLLLFIMCLVDVLQITKDMFENDFIQEKVILVNDEKYNNGIIYSRRYVFFTNEAGEMIKLWSNDDIYYSLEPTFEGTIVYARRSKCIVSISLKE